MTKRTRRNHAPAFKAKVALAALKGEKTLAELAQLLRRSLEPDHRLEGATGRGCGWAVRRRAGGLCVRTIEHVVETVFGIKPRGARLSGRNRSLPGMSRVNRLKRHVIAHSPFRPRAASGQQEPHTACHRLERILAAV